MSDTKETIETTSHASISGVVRSIYSEMKYDNTQVQTDGRYTKGFKEGYAEAVRNLAIIIKQEAKIDVRK